MARWKIAMNDSVEALFTEKALAMFRELRQTAKNAPDGEVLHQAELFAVREGQELIRQGLESVIQDQAEEVEKKGRRPERVLAEELAHIAAERGNRGSRRLG
jgi:hypothetical protein